MSESRTAHVLRALHGFFSGFMPAYAEGCAPDGAACPYITYQMVAPDALGEAGFSARVWFRARGYADIAAAVDAFNREILRAHVKTCVVRDIRAGRDEVADELIATLERLTR